ncbi:hypothetical protein COW36_11220 [bacterium (Candidatus Blackallbacteria) CG17_big_fil_post_rev_8_21_14_2_50_48_46]|uniref:Type 4 fimbrial biogenesis protein PilX N-terminal domain-containing protein n=1 Tax=bacterium (Candidatus Blackallbacteria) CG17_big_fil_post_rev_8_21_14_2_50_48_46 TaxID=2014261 RepID=A0A2M7G4J6_9BACT|nr:MAG: hypothetical protein COW64_18315 [bacterium (Candidatus Blackallbacteria) CG18_big_fil_WC_8_21_14_2_50_49_26]PIW16845.1 MAG: hypothetical protein COW36_11220 [bacterium (Candidatus Blackallbacteria) CG17_big_fil_post_rev_8_21_14_2_50_48_46]PIW48042.1 MAG: hypothetical protein COW20_10935 [bacterium (Candidatus Blackallbacteria) CG13_big_fil_rev_8_21_14_2_50_49_14]
MQRKIKPQKGSALLPVMILVVVMSALMGAMAMKITGHVKVNQRTVLSEKALMIAEAGIQRALTGLTWQNDNMSWELKDLTQRPANAPESFWLWKWQTVKDSKGLPIGRYWLEILPAESNRRLMRIKAIGQIFADRQGGTSGREVQRTLGVEFRQVSLGDFAIASNHQLGGTRINGGARIHGGIFTAGKLHLDASSTGIYNDYTDLNDNQNFQGYSLPVTPPEAEVFVYKDPLSADMENGVVKLAAQADLGTSANPMQAIHVQENSNIIDPGTGMTGTAGDGIIGQGQEKAKGKKDHTLPSVSFPDASVNSSFMNARKNEAQNNGNAIYTGDLVLGNSDFSLGSGPALSYNASTHELVLQGTVYIIGNLSIPQSVSYTGKGALFVEGNVQAPEGLEPKDSSNFPNTEALGLVCSGNMELGRNSGDSSRYAGFFFGNQSITVQKAKIYGNIFGNTVNLPTTGTRPDIYVHPDLMGSIGVALPDFSKAEILRNKWWEMKGRLGLKSPD